MRHTKHMHNFSLWACKHDKFRFKGMPCSELSFQKEDNNILKSAKTSMVVTVWVQCEEKPLTKQFDRETAGRALLRAAQPVKINCSFGVSRCETVQVADLPLSQLHFVPARHGFWDACSLFGRHVVFPVHDSSNVGLLYTQRACYALVLAEALSFRG